MSQHDVLVGQGKCAILSLGFSNHDSVPHNCWRSDQRCVRKQLSCRASVHNAWSQASICDSHKWRCCTKRQALSCSLLSIIASSPPCTLPVRTQSSDAQSFKPLQSNCYAAGQSVWCMPLTWLLAETRELWQASRLWPCSLCFLRQSLDWLLLTSRCVVLKPQVTPPQNLLQSRSMHQAHCSTDATILLKHEFSWR